MQQGFLSETQLAQALNRQRTDEPRKLLGELCVELGFMSKGALNGVLEKYHKQILIGDLFLHMGIVSIGQMHEALEDQKTTKKKLGQILIEKRFIARTHLAEALSIQLGIPKIAPSVSLVDTTLLSMATPGFLKRNCVVPLSYGEAKNTITVLMDDPLDTAVIADLEKVFRAKVQPAVSATIDVSSFLKEVFDSRGPYCGYVPEAQEPCAVGGTGALPLQPAQEMTFGKKETPCSQPGLADGEAGMETPPLARFRTGGTNKDQPAALRISVRKTADTASSCSPRAVDANMLDLSIMEGHSIELSAVGKETTLDDKDSHSAVANENAAAILNFIVFSAIKERASDIHIEPFEDRVRIRYRVDGVLRCKTDLPKSIIGALTSRIKGFSGLDLAERRRLQNGRIEAGVDDKEFDLRVSTYAAPWGENVAIRVQRRTTSLIDIGELGFSPLNLDRYQRVLSYPAGIVFVTGPAGSGKTTTLYASLTHLNHDGTKIVTVEDPIEHTIDGVVQGRLDSTAGLSYEDSIESMMRQDPDVIMIDELGDKAGASAAIQASLAGHKVFASFHADGAIATILRLISMGIEPFLVSTTMNSIVSLRLVRTLCPFCKQPTAPDESMVRRFTSIKPGGSYGACTFYRAVGCPECDNVGYKGRTGVHELIEINEPVKETILARATERRIRTIARESARFISMAEDGFYKAASGITTLEDVLRVVSVNAPDDSIPYDLDHLMAFCDGTRDKIIPGRQDV